MMDFIVVIGMLGICGYLMLQVRIIDEAIEREQQLLNEELDNDI